MRSKSFQVNADTDVHVLLNHITFLVRQNVSNPIIETEICTIVSELAYNIIKYGDKGDITITLTTNECLISARDSGGGMLMPIEQAFVEGNSSSGSLGLGMSSIVRMSDDFELVTSSTGTTITCTKRY